MQVLSATDSLVLLFVFVLKSLLSLPHIKVWRLSLFFLYYYYLIRQCLLNILLCISRYNTACDVSYAVPILGFWGPYAKLCRQSGGGGGGGGVVEEWMKRICPCYTPSRIALAEGARETVSLRGKLSTCFFFFCFFFKQETV